MKGFMEATLEEDPCHTEPSLKAIGGQTCKMRHKNMQGSATSVKDSHQTYTNWEECLTHLPALGHSLNGAWTLLALSPRQQGTRGIC